MSTPPNLSRSSDVLRWTTPMLVQLKLYTRVLTDGTTFTIHYWPCAA